MHLNIYSFKFLQLKFSVFKFSRWGIWCADSQLWGQGDTRSGSGKAVLKNP